MNCVHLLTPGVKRARKSSDSLEEEEEVMLMLPDVSTAYTTMEPNFAIIIDTKEKCPNSIRTEDRHQIT